jgi:membrane protease YdiL (CAAX protease family)
MKFITRVLGGILALSFTLFFPLIGSECANRSAGANAITWLYLHHIVQMALAFLTILLIVVFSKKQRLSNWGLNLHEWRWSVKTASLFAVVWFVISLVLSILFTFPSQIQYELTATNIISDLTFDFVLTGFSEEILFRGLIMGVLLLSWRGSIRIGSFKISVAGIVATVLFSLAHIGIDYRTLSITAIYPLQLVFTTGLGLFYAVMRDKTGSLVGPIIAHGASDGLVTVVQLILR